MLFHIVVRESAPGPNGELRVVLPRTLAPDAGHGDLSGWGLLQDGVPRRVAARQACEMDARIGEECEREWSRWIAWQGGIGVRRRRHRAW